MSDHNPNAFKHWYNKTLLERMASSLRRHETTFPVQEFLRVGEELPALELKDRVRLIRAKLRECLPADYKKALNVLCASARDEELTGFDLWPYTDFVENYGLDHPEASLQALHQLTQKFTGEFAVRPFLVKHRDFTLKRLKQWAEDAHPHVRRWASEGTRPRLPWGLRLRDFIARPALTLPLLEKLKYDDSLFVRKSVANHLNDIAKDHPRVVVATLKKWQKCPQAHAEKIAWITRHALRTLIKQGDAEALALLGYKANNKVQLSALKLTKKTYRIGDVMEFSFALRNGSRELMNLVVDYVIHHRRANGELSPKVFKLKSLQLKAGERVMVRKKHSLKLVTTRKYYPGPHRLEIQVNGRRLAATPWQLVK